MSGLRNIFYHFYCYFTTAADGSKFVASPNLKREHETTKLDKISGII